MQPRLYVCIFKTRSPDETCGMPSAHISLDVAHENT